MAQLPDIWRDFDRPSSQMGTWRPLLRQLDDFINDFSMFTRIDDNRRAIVPSCDIEESEEHMLFSFDMPGLDKNNIEVEVQGNRLMVSGERRSENERGEGVARMVERRYGRFERSVMLPEGINPQEVEAQYVNGVLKVAIPKQMESRAKIKVGDGESGLFSRLAKKIGGSKDSAGAVDVKSSSERAGHASAPQSPP